MKIRKAVKKDLKGIYSILLNEFSKPPYNEKWNNKSAKEFINYYVKIGAFIYVVFDKKEIIGFVIWREWIPSGGKMSMIEELAVKKEFQGKGIGKWIMKKVETICKKRGNKQIILTAARDEKSCNFYRKLKYKESKDTVVFRKKLK